VLWGSTFLAIRLGVETIPPLLMAASRWLLAGTVLYTVCRLARMPRPRLSGWPKAFALASLLIVCSNGGVTWAETRVSSGIAALLVASVSFWMVLLDWLLPGGKRPSARVAGGVVLGFAGVGLLSGPHGEGLRVDPYGLAVLLLSSIAWSAGSHLSKRFVASEAPLVSAAMQMLAGGTLLTLLSLLTGELRGFVPAHVALRSAVSVVYLAAFGSLAGFTLFLWLMRTAPPPVVATYACVNPVVAVLLGWAFLHEPVTPRMLAATVVIVASVALIISKKLSPPQNDPVDVSRCAVEPAEA
jgi:drug/metabolite transporter (DMT)-like permease